MYSFIKLLQITLLLFLSLTLGIIPWIPSLLVENIVNFSIVGIFIAAGYLVYLIIKKLHHAQKKINIYKSTAYTLLLFAYLGFFAIAQIGVSLGKSQYIKTYAFEHLTFYTYEMDGGTEVSIKEMGLPIRSLPIAFFADTAIVLRKEGKYIYAIGKDVHESVYDLKENISTEQLKNMKENND